MHALPAVSTDAQLKPLCSLFLHCCGGLYVCVCGVFFALRYIGFLTRCALSKPFPELSIINIIKAMSMATGRIPEELSAEVFGDSTEADQLAYAGTPTTRPIALRTMPFSPVVRSGKRTPAQIQLQRQSNDLLRTQLRSAPLRPSITAILEQDSREWDVNSDDFHVALCGLGAVRDRGYEKVWDAREDGQLFASGTWSTNRHVFACACSGQGDSMVPVSATVEASPSPCSLPPSLSSLDFSSLSSSSADCSPPSIRHCPALRCSQRAPFDFHEDIAYGLVKRWIAVRQGSGLSTMIAHVRIFFSSLEEVPDTGCPIIHQRSLPAYEDHYMLARYIVCRIALAPLPNDTSRFLVSHVV
jgi:hypothetical protein